MPAVYVMFVVGLFCVPYCSTPIAAYLLAWGCAAGSAVAMLLLRDWWGDDDDRQ